MILFTWLDAVVLFIMFAIMFPGWTPKDKDKP